MDPFQGTLFSDVPHGLVVTSFSGPESRATACGKPPGCSGPYDLLVRFPSVPSSGALTWEEGRP